MHGDLQKEVGQGLDARAFALCRVQYGLSECSGRVDSLDCAPCAVRPVRERGPRAREMRSYSQLLTYLLTYYLLTIYYLRTIELCQCRALAG